MKADFIRLAILGVTALILTVTGITAFTDTGSRTPQPSAMMPQLKPFPLHNKIPGA